MNTDWKICCDSATFDSLKNRKDFGHLLALARAVNALTYVHSTYRDGDSPADTRARVNMFLFACAILCEGLNLVRKMEDHFASNNTFANGLRPLLADATAQMIRDAHMKKVRNRGTFHFDPLEFKKRAARSPSHECTFAVGQRADRETEYQEYYDFADALVLDMFVGLSGGADDAYFEIAKQRMPEVRDLAFRFIASANQLIRESLMDWGFTLRSARTAIPSAT